MSTNDTFLAVFLGSKTSSRMKVWIDLSESEQRAKEQDVIVAWKPYIANHHGASVPHHHFPEPPSFHHLSGRVLVSDAGSANSRLLIGSFICSSIGERTNRPLDRLVDRQYFGNRTVPKDLGPLPLTGSGLVLD